MVANFQNYIKCNNVWSVFFIIYILHIIIDRKIIYRNKYNDFDDDKHYWWFLSTKKKI